MTIRHPIPAVGKPVSTKIIHNPAGKFPLRAPPSCRSVALAEGGLMSGRGIAAMKAKIMLTSDQAKATDATSRRRAAKPPEKTAATAPPLLKSKPKNLFARAVKTAKKILKPRRSPVRPKTLEVPPILLEGDQTAPPPAGGPGEKYSLGPTPPAPHFETAETDLPEAYGTKKHSLTARDPHRL
jgi:hypothetical protein